jgi:hypothetical protein
MPRGTLKDAVSEENVASILRVEKHALPENQRESRRQGELCHVFLRNVG